MTEVKNIKNKVLPLLLAAVLLFGLMPFGTITAFADGTTYYVSADGSTGNSGTAPDSPVTLEMINSKTLHGGDTVLFKRGDTFYGYLRPKVTDTSDSSRVTFDAYGDGALPVLSFAKIISGGWSDCGNGFWKFDLSDDSKSSGLRNSVARASGYANKLDSDNGNLYNYANVGFFEDKDGNIYGERYETADGINQKYQFYCDDNFIYVYTDKNPYEDLGTLTLAMHHGELIRLADGTTFKNFHLMYCGYGMGKTPGFLQNVNVENCVIEKIGGIDIDDGNGFIRGGNGIELYNSAKNVVIKNNLFRDIFDVGFTCQGYGTWTDITVTNNIFAYNTQSLEVWCGPTDDYYESGVNGLTFSNNLSLGQSEGWTSYRTEIGSHNVTDILSYGYFPARWDMTLSGNTYLHRSDAPAFFGLNIDSDYKFITGEYSWTEEDTTYTGNFKVSSDNNYYYGMSQTCDFRRTHHENKVRYLNFAGWQRMGQDINSTFTAIGDELESYDILMTVAAKSCNFNDIADEAVNAGLEINTAYDAGAITEKTTENSINTELDGGIITSDVELLGDKCEVTVTALPDTGRQLKSGSLKYICGGISYPIIDRVNAACEDGSFNEDSESQCTSFTFVVDASAESVTVTAEFIEAGQKNLAVIGTSINTESYKLRFRSRAARSYITNGKEYTIKSCGTMLFKEAPEDLEASYHGINRGKVVGKIIKCTGLFDRCDDYFEYVCSVNYGSQDSRYLDDTYYAYAYAVYEAADGSSVRVYSDIFAAQSYNSVAEIVL